MRPVKYLLLSAVVGGLTAGAVLAQGGGGGGGGGGGFAAFQKFRDQHKYQLQLRTMMTNGLMECERSKTTALKPDQAKKLLGVMTPLRKQPKMTQDQAKGTIQKIQQILDTKQMTAMDKAVQASNQRRGGGGPGGGGPGGGGPGGGGPGGGRPGGGGPGGGGPGGGGPGGGRPAPNFAAMQNFNPFNPQPGSFRYEDRKASTDKLYAFLQARAAGKEAKLDLPQRGRGGPGGPGGPGGRPGAAPAAPGGRR